MKTEFLKFPQVCMYRYCLCPQYSCRYFIISFSGLEFEATFTPSKDISTAPLPEQPSYHFITECFFLCQQALHQGFSVVPKLIKLRRSVHNLNKLYEYIKENYPPEVVEPVREQTNRGKFCMLKFLF